MGKGGNGGGGKTEFDWNDQLKPYWTSLLASAQGNANAPFHSYTGDTGQYRTAPINNDQNEAMGYTRGMARQNSSPATYDPQTGQFGGVLNDTRSQLDKTVNGGFLGSNPFAGPGVANPYIADNVYSHSSNPYADQNTQTDRNLFAGDNPYFRDTMLGGMKDIADVYTNATEPDVRAQMVLNGTLGGGAQQQITDRNQAALAKQLQSYSDSMLNKQYDRSAGLEDSFLGRDVQNQQFNKGQAMQSADNMLGRQYQGEESRLGRGYQDFAGNVDRGFTGYENERQRMQGAIPLGQAEQGLAYQRIGGMTGIGDFNQQQQQKYNDENYGNWFDANNNGRNMNSWLAGILSGAQGGLPPSQMTNPYGGQGAGLANALGTGLAAYGMFRQ